MASTKPFIGLSDAGLHRMQGLINGQWVDAIDGKTIKVANPATGEKLGTVPDMGRAETLKAIEAAGNAFKTWRRTTAKHRHDLLIKLSRLMIEHSEDLWLLLTLENGKPLPESKQEIVSSTSFIEWFAEEAVRVYGEIIPSPYAGTRNLVIKQPIGVVAAITAWNFPSAMITRKLGAALAAGCTVVLKPAPETPYSALALAELACRAGFPDGVFNVVTSLQHVQDVGSEMCENKAVKKLTFTGSGTTAKRLYKQAAGTLKRISIEAGGNAPFIVFEDADIDKAVQDALSCKFFATGQNCLAVNRFYVQTPIYNEFADRMVEKVAAFRVGNGLKDGTTHGPMIHSRAMEKVETHIKNAVERGAVLRVGGRRMEGPGEFFMPAVLSGVPSDALLSREETFGPLAALISFEKEEDVLRFANNSEVGLAGYFYSCDVRRVWRIAEALEVGMLGVNSCSLASASAPFGGVKESGIGRELSHGVEEYLNIKSISFGVE